MSTMSQTVNVPHIGYLGPKGTFSEEIALGFYRGVTGRFIPYPGIDAVMRAVEAGELTEAIVPVENSLEGSVNVTLDTLAHEAKLYIIKEVIQPVRHNLLLQPGTNQIDVIVSHTQALAQCRQYLTRHFPGAELRPVDSTAAGAYLVAGGAKNHAAVASLRAASIYNLQVAAADIQDHPHNSTRFVVVAREPAVLPGDSAKTSIICQLSDDKPGSLYELLAEFALRQVNLTKIESRPARTGLGRYIFFLDIAGSVSDKNIEAAVNAVKLKSQWFKFLGSYPLYTNEEQGGME